MLRKIFAGALYKREVPRARFAGARRKESPRRHKARRSAAALLAALLRRLLISRGRIRAAPLPTHLLRICAGTLKRREQCAVSEFASGQRHTVALPRKHLLTLFPQIFCSAKSLREPYKGGAARPHVRARGGRLRLDFSGSFPIKAVLFFRQNPQAPFFPLPENRFFLSRRRGRRSMREKGRGAPKKTSPPRTTGSGNNKFARRREKGRAPQKKHPRPVKRKGRHNPRLRKQQKNSSSARPHGGGIYLPNSVVTGAGRFGTSRLELNVESNFRCDQVGRSLQVLFIRSALRPFGEIVRWSVLLIRDLPRLTGNEVCHIKRTSRYEIFSE